MTPTTPVIFYDGVCGLCDRSVQFLIRHDTRRRLRYAALQSDLAFTLLQHRHTTDSFVYVENNIAYYRSDAALKALQQIGGGWRLTGVFFIIPRFIRDAVYNYMARNRYRWFGKYDSCKIPTPEQRSLFLDQL